MQFLPSFTADEKRRLRSLLDKEIVGDGEYVGASAMFMRDSAPSHSVYLTDSDPNAWARNVRDAAHAAQLDPAMRSINEHTVDAAPAAGISVDQRAMRDAARASQWG